MRKMKIFKKVISILKVNYFNEISNQFQFISWYNDKNKHKDHERIAVTYFRNYFSQYFLKKTTRHE